jgi:hypothetical protein
MEIGELNAEELRFRSARRVVWACPAKCRQWRWQSVKSQAGNGLVMDKETIARLHTLSRMYVGEDLLAKTENLHRSQATEKKEVEKVM